jgi:hypothetical protein
VASKLLAPSRPSATTIHDQRSYQSRHVFPLLLTILVVVTIAAAAVPNLNLPLIVLPAVALLPWIWRRTIRGLYIVFGAAVVIEQLPLRFPDSLTDKVPLFLNLSNANSSSGLSGIPIAPFEIVLLLVSLIWIAKAISERTITLPEGPLVTAYLIFGGIVLMAEVHGMAVGAPFNLTLWELRPQVYAFVAFIFAGSLVRQKRDVVALAVILLVGVAFKGALGSYRYLVTLHGDTGGLDSIMAHEESFFFGLFLVATLCCLIWLPRRRLLVALLGASPMVALALLENKRRVGELGLLLGVAVVMAVAIRFERSQRGRLVLISLIAIAAYGSILLLYWDRTSGMGAALARPVSSMFSPDPRDYLSNIYRVAEDANILATFRSSPVIGVGFGRPMFDIVPMADISQIYPLWNIIPHNTLLWIGMRMGSIGFIAFWGLIGIAILHAMRELTLTDDPVVKAVCAFAVAAIVTEIAAGYGDLQLETYRNMILIGTVMGVLAALPRLRRE